jgi:hypothetical protein
MIGLFQALQTRPHASTPTRELRYSEIVNPIREASFGVEQLFDKAYKFVVVLTKGTATGR